MNCTRSFPRSLLFLLLLFLLTLLAACRTTPAASEVMAASTPTAPAVQAESRSTPVAQVVAARSMSATQLPSVQYLMAPVSLAIPEIDLMVAVTPMEWRVAEVNGTRTTIWSLPDEGAGWHPNSAVLGAEGNIVISGHQLFGDAPFAAIALGDVEIGQELLLTAANGTVFTYRVVEVSEPLPISKNFEQEATLAAPYLAQSDEPGVTLISGWPDFSSTHRIIVTAQLVDAAAE
jgi:sortase (surface protein transpeptidase)